MTQENMQQLKLKDFEKWINIEEKFAATPGIGITKGHREELEAMKKIYSQSKDDEDFSRRMYAAGYGWIPNEK